MSVVGQSLPKWAVRAMSGLPPIATELRTWLVVRFVPLPEVMDLPIRSPHRRRLAGSVECRVGVVQPAVCAQAARSKSVMKSRVIGTASRLVDSSI